jgi:basic amino acid/polyamine antiporter, APA family
MSEQTQKIGVLTATISGMNAMIGAGVFTLPVVIGLHLGPASIVTVILVSIAVLCMALSIARLAALFPQEGSFYTYAKQWGGHAVGLMSSGAYLIGLLIAMGLLCRAAGTNLHYYIPTLSSTTLGIITLTALVVLNMFGVALTRMGQHILIFCTVLPLAIITGLCFSKAKLANLFPFAPYGHKNILFAMREVIFGFFGFEVSASLVPRMINPQQNVPKAVTFSVIFVALIYTLFIGSLVLSVPFKMFDSIDTPIVTVLENLFPDVGWLLQIVHISILSAILGTIHSMIWSSSALTLSLVKLLRSNAGIKMVRRGYITNRSTVIFVGLCILTSFLTFESKQFFSFTALFVVFAYATAMITLLTIKEEWRSKSILITIVGLSTAGLIFAFALEGVVQTLFC